jgi:protein O-GlcNAc transferase
MLMSTPLKTLPARHWVVFCVGDLTQAEALYHKALKLHEAIGHKEGMANQYNNLAHMYYMRGNLDQTEAMLLKALTLFQEIGVTPEVERVQKSLRTLRAQDSP